MNHSLRTARDELLALRCQLGEPGAFADLVQEMERPLLYFARQFVRDDQLARDVLQEVWVRALKSIRRLREPQQLRAWLYQQTRSLALDTQRQHYSRAVRESVYAAEQPRREEMPDPTLTQEDIAQLHVALESLEIPHREVLALHFLEELSIAETAFILDCPQGTVKSRLHHAKRVLRSKLQKPNHE